MTQGNDIARIKREIAELRRQEIALLDAARTLKNQLNQIPLPWTNAVKILHGQLRSMERALQNIQDMEEIRYGRII